MGDWHEMMIQRRYAMMIEEVKGSTLYGVPIDTTDARQVAIAAYFKGHFVARAEMRHERRMLAELGGR
jgi:hypothetical protein